MTSYDKDLDLTIQAYDLDLFKSNDFIGQFVLNMRPMIEDSELAKRPINLTKEYYEQYLKPECKIEGLTFKGGDNPPNSSFWVNLESKEKVKERMVTVVNGRARISVEVVPKGQAESNPVGAAREEPNVNPYLPQPEGRLEFSINPIKMLNQLVGPALRRKLYCACLVAACCALCIFMLPMILSNAISSILFG